MRFLLIILITLAATSTAMAKDWSKLRLLEPTGVSIDVYRNLGVHDPYLYPEDRHLSYGSNFNVDLDLVAWKHHKFYWENKLHFDQSGRDGKIKHVGWNYKFGLTLLRFKDKTVLEAFKEHHSRHLVEERRERHFPVYDRYGVSIILLGE